MPFLFCLSTRIPTWDYARKVFHSNPLPKKNLVLDAHLAEADSPIFILYSFLEEPTLRSGLAPSWSAHGNASSDTR